MVCVVDTVCGVRLRGLHVGAGVARAASGPRLDSGGRRVGRARRLRHLSGGGSEPGSMTDPTPRQQQLIDAVEKYGGVKPAARNLGVSPSTIRSAMKRVGKKRSRTKCRHGF